MTDAPHITCPKCWRTSYDPNDIQQRYCGYCHEFIGEMDGEQRHRRRSTPAGSQGEMRMQPDNQEPEAQPEMPEVSRTGDSRSLRSLRGERMEPSNESPMRNLYRNGIQTDPLKPLPEWLESVKPKRNVFRFYLMSVATGMAIGVAWTIALTSPGIERWISHAHAIKSLWALIGIIYALQMVYLLQDMKRIKKETKQLNEFMKAMGYDAK